MELKMHVYGKIKKPIAEVFDAVYNPKKLSAYFTTGGASAPLDEGKTVTWDFKDFPGAFPVYVKETILDKKIVFEWASQAGNFNITVEFTFEALDAESTRVDVRESGWKETNPKALEEVGSHQGGWMHMLCCLKMHVEHGINMREFFF